MQSISPRVSLPLPTSKTPPSPPSTRISTSAVINRGDEVILFDPCYETYDTCIRLVGGIPAYVGLDPPHWTLSSDKLEKSVTNKTKALVLNRTLLTPSRTVLTSHNPTGKVFMKDELEIIARACKRRDVLAVTDEHITFDNARHVSLASLPDMQRRTIITSSLSKTFSVNGWRIGWAIAPSCIASAIRNIHIKITDSAPAPFHEAALTALRNPPAYFTSLRRRPIKAQGSGYSYAHIGKGGPSDYESKRDSIFNLLEKVGFNMQFKPQGSFFVFAEFPESCSLSDVEFVEELIKQASVVAVPGCGFFHTNPESIPK